MFSNSNSFGGGTNIGFGETYDQQNTQTHTNEPEPKQINENQNTNSNQNKNQKTKINSSNINFGSNIAYSSEKTQASIGQGNIVVKDKDNSDELNSLNRDINNMNNLLYGGSIGLDVESVTEGVLSKTIGSSITSVFNIEGAVDALDGATNILDIVDETLNIADNVFKIKNNGIAIYKEVDSFINQFKKDDLLENQQIQNGEDNNQNKLKESIVEEGKIILEKAETTVLNLIDIRDGVKDIGGSMGTISNINNFGDIFQVDNTKGINSLIDGIKKVDGALNQNNYIEEFLNNSGSRDMLKIIYGVNNGLEFIIDTQGKIDTANEFYRKVKK
jgi:hypothetical protein